MVTACCMAILLSILRNHLSFESQNQLSCAALRRNPTNFCLCYLKLLFAAASPAVTADSGAGLETRTPLQAGTDPALPSLWILQHHTGTEPAAGSGSGSGSAPGFPLEEKISPGSKEPHGSTPKAFVSNSLVLLPLQSAAFSCR